VVDSALSSEETLTTDGFWWIGLVQASADGVNESLSLDVVLLLHPKAGSTLAKVSEKLLAGGAGDAKPRVASRPLAFG
jgi:hypothetical protein